MTVILLLKKSNKMSQNKLKDNKPRKSNKMSKNKLKDNKPRKSNNH